MGHSSLLECQSPWPELDLECMSAKQTLHFAGNLMETSGNTGYCLDTTIYSLFELASRLFLYDYT